MDKKANFNAWYLMIAVLVMVVVQGFWQQAQRTEYLPYSEFETYLKDGKIDNLTITETKIIGELKGAEEGQPNSLRHHPGRAGVRRAAPAIWRRVPRRHQFQLLLQPFSWVLPDRDLLRHLDVAAAPHVDGRHGCRRPDVDRQEQGQDLRREGHQDHLRRCRRRRGGQGGAEGGRRFPEGPQGLRRARRAAAARRAPGGPARHRQDPFGARRRRRGGRHLPFDQRLRVRRDVRRRRRRAGARSVRAGAQDGALHHLHRRARRDGPGARHRPDGGRPRREGADPEPAPGRAGRLRSEPGDHPAGGDQPAGDPGSRAAAARPVRSPDPGRPAGQAGPHPDPRMSTSAR